jgi:hypothetical protein
MFHTITRMRLDLFMSYGLTLELSPYALRNETARLGPGRAATHTLFKPAGHYIL